MRKIFHYTDTPIVGGAEKHIHDLAKELVKDGYETTVICSKFKQLDQWCQLMKEDHINVIRLDVSHKHDPKHLLQLRTLFKKEQPDLLHLHLWNPGACRYAFLAAPKTLKIVSTEHDPFPLSSLKKIIKKKLQRKSAQTIAISEHCAIQMLKWYPELKDKITVIPNGIDNEAFEKGLVHFTNQEKARIKQQLFRALANDIIITSVAALHPRKGLIHLLEAHELVLRNRPDVKLIIVGEGPERKDLEKRIKKMKIENSVRLLGHQDNIYQILKSSDLFVLPSIKEAFGLVLLEAMSAQLPIIASRVGGIPEIVQDQKSGLLVEPGNDKQLAEVILYLIKNKALREKMAFLGHHRVKDFDIKEMAKKTEMVYDRILSS